MEMLASAIFGDLVSRSISFIIEKYGQHRAGMQENPQRLHQVLLRIQTTVMEADRRHITNQGMLQQLQMVREGMYNGYYMLDTFKYRAPKENPKDEVSHSFALFRFNPAKRVCFSIRNTQAMVFGSDSIRELQEMLDSLECMIANMEEFIIFLKSYPRMCRQIYSMHLLLDKCMFGRQMERERIINFLLAKEPPVARNISVLPIIGAPRVGKSTLVEYVCSDERVRDHFGSIVLFNGNDLKDKTLTSIRDSGLIKHQARAPHDRWLVIIELEEDLDEEEWRSLYSSGNDMASGTKIIITSRSKAIANYATTQPLTLKFLPREAYWYFFKVVAFGSTNPEEHPKLASISMKIAEGLKGDFLGANIIGGLLRANLNTPFYCRALKCLKEATQKNLFLFGEHQNDLLLKDRPIYFGRMVETSKVSFAYNFYQTCSSQHELSRITLQELISGSARPFGKFEALVWRSHIPPYHNYLASCVIKTPQNMVVNKKRSRTEVAIRATGL